jgi:hypothetical protein
VLDGSEREGFEDRSILLLHAAENMFLDAFLCSDDLANNVKRSCREVGQKREAGDTAKSFVEGHPSMRRVLLGYVCSTRNDHSKSYADSSHM